ncbi:MAG: prepilin-type N-terminal cleavage/methylation domain-containing protein [Rickettsiales bacterium]|nr:prepilin-type N-terminal cleavage/methylation domain-containing protein [Rickettsiales bacterium]
MISTSLYNLMRNKSKAFSLIELSIVILVVGILVAGVIQGNSMINKFLA